MVSAFWGREWNVQTHKKLAATVSRCEDVYNRTGKPTFCERETQGRVTDF